MQVNKVSVKRLSTTVKAKLALDASKSITNRLLIIKYLTESNAEIINASKSDDSQRIEASLRQINLCASSRIPLVIDAGNAGTVFRFLTAYLSQKEGKWLLTGSARMQDRPVGILVDALNKLGGRITCTSSKNHPPVLIEGRQLSGGELTVDSSVSSQFISSLMMIGPTMKGGLKLELTGEKVSFPYIELTAEIMRQCGINVHMGNHRIVIPEGTYQMSDSDVEPDWSSASYWYEIAALANASEIYLEGFRKDSFQGDRLLASLFEELGVKTEFLSTGILLTGTGAYKKEISCNLAGQPDLVPAFLATCAVKGVKARISGVDHLQFKESDRIESLATELAKTGARINHMDGVLEFQPGKPDPADSLEFETHNDHRIAMCLAPLALYFDSVMVNDPQVVVKSYPDFWLDMKNSGLFSVDKK